MWIFEWDILTGDTATLDVLYEIPRDRGRRDEVAAGAAKAVADGRARCATLVAATDAATWRDAALRDAFLGALDYEADVLRAARRRTARCSCSRASGTTPSTPPRYAAWADARDEYVALADAHIETYTATSTTPRGTSTAAAARRRARRSRPGDGVDRPRPARCSRSAWLVIGMVAARTRLVRRPGAAAARASWLASTRPWRARESTLGMLPLDRWLLLVVPGALLVATRAVQTSFLSWTHLAVVLGAWLVFARRGRAVPAAPLAVAGHRRRRRASWCSAAS